MTDFAWSVAFKSSTIGSAQVMIGGSESANISVEDHLTILECNQDHVLDEKRANNIKRLVEIWSKGRAADAANVASASGASATHMTGELCTEDINFLLQNHYGESCYRKSLRLLMLVVAQSITRGLNHPIPNGMELKQINLNSTKYQ